MLCAVQATQCCEGRRLSAVQVAQCCMLSRWCSADAAVLRAVQVMQYHR